MELGHLPGDIKPQAMAALTCGWFIARLKKGSKKPIDFSGIDTDTVVANVEDEILSIELQSHMNIRASMRVLDGIGDEVVDDLPNLLFIHPHHQVLPSQGIFKMHLNLLGSSGCGSVLEGANDHFRQVHIGKVMGRIPLEITSLEQGIAHGQRSPIH